MILVIAAAFVAGMVVSAPEIYAPPPPNNPGQPFDAILQKLDEIIAAIGSIDIDTSGLATQSSVDDVQSSVDDIETDLLSKKSFYEVEDIVNFVGGQDRNFDILVSLSCPDSVPAEKQAFSIETMGVQVSHTNDDNQVAFFNSTVIDQSFGFFYAEAISTFIGSELVSKDPSKKSQSSINSATTIGASDEVRFGGNVVNIDGVEEIKLKAVAIGQKPQGCTVTIDADAAHLGLPLPPP